MKDSIVKYIDTDSVFLHYGRFLSKLGVDFNDRGACVKTCLDIDKRVELVIKKNCDQISDVMNVDNMFAFESEELIERLLIPSKKKYIARLAYDKTTGSYLEDQYIIKGMDFQKSNLSDTIKKFLKETTIKLMDGLTKDELSDILKEMFYKMGNMPVEDLSYYQGIKNIQKYDRMSSIQIFGDPISHASVEFPKGIPYHVVAALVMNKLIVQDRDLSDMSTIIDGQKSGLVFVCPDNIFGVKAVAYVGEWNPKLYEYFKLDVEYMFDRLVLGPLKKIMEVTKSTLTLPDVLGFKFVNADNTMIQSGLF